jgi:hypothetical protein
MPSSKETKSNPTIAEFVPLSIASDLRMDLPLLTEQYQQMQEVYQL